MASAQAACSRLVVTADPAYPPLHWYDGSSLQGASIEIAKRVLDDLKIPYEVRYVGPLPRVLMKAERGEVDMVATLKKTAEREAVFSYPKTAAFSNPVAVFAARKHLFPFHDRRDLVGLRGGITIGNLFGDGLDEYLREHLKFEEANSPANNFDKLSLGRIDYFLTGFYAGTAYLSQRGEEDKFVALTPYVAATQNYLALARKGHCLDRLDQIEARLALLKKTGVVDELIRQSILRWKERPTLVDY